MEWYSKSESRTGGVPGLEPGSGMVGHDEAPGLAQGAAPRLHECQHGCKKLLGDIISFFFRFISGNLARGEDAPQGWGGSRKGHLGRSHSHCPDYGLQSCPVTHSRAVSAKPGLPDSWARRRKAEGRGFLLQGHRLRLSIVGGEEGAPCACRPYCPEPPPPHSLGTSVPLHQRQA